MTCKFVMKKIIQKNSFAVPTAFCGSARVSYIRNQLFGAIATTNIAAGKTFAAQLTIFLWLLIAKIEAPRGEMVAITAEVAKKGQGQQRIQNLRCQLLLKALVEVGALKSASRKDHRLNSTPLQRIADKHIHLIAKKYSSLRELKKRFLPAKKNAALTAKKKPAAGADSSSVASDATELRLRLQTITRAELSQSDLKALTTLQANIINLIPMDRTVKTGANRHADKSAPTKKRKPYANSKH